MNEQLANRFAIAYREGKTGKLDNFHDYLKMQEIKWDYLKSQPFLELLSNDTSLFFNREEEIEKAGRLFGFTLENEKPGHLPIVGIDMIGKSAFLRMLKNLLFEIDKDISYSWINAKRFEEGGHDNIPKVLAWLDEIEIEPPKIIFIEDAGTSLYIGKILEKIFSFGFNGLLVTTWTPEQWKSTEYQIDSDLAHLLLHKLDINLLKQEDTVNFFRSYFSKVKIGNNKNILPFSERSIEIIADYSEGVPGIIIELIYETLKILSIEKDSEIIELIEKITRKNSIYQLKEKTQKYSRIQKQILFKVLTTPDPRGISPIEINRELRRDRSTISSYLSKFVSEGILERSKIGKYSYFRIRGLCKPFIQLAIQEEDLFIG